MTIINHLKRKYLVEGIINDINCSSVEEYKTFVFGSSDRKGYTVKTTCKWLSEQIDTFTEIQPFDGAIPEIIERVEKESKYKCAEMIYQKHFNPIT